MSGKFKTVENDTEDKHSGPLTTDKSIRDLFAPKSKREKSKQIIKRPTLERRKTLGHLSSINPNMIIHFANQSQTANFWKS